MWSGRERHRHPWPRQHAATRVWLAGRTPETKNSRNAAALRLRVWQRHQLHHRLRRRAERLIWWQRRVVFVLVSLAVLNKGVATVLVVVVLACCIAAAAAGRLCWRGSATTDGGLRRGWAEKRSAAHRRCYVRVRTCAGERGGRCRAEGEVATGAYAGKAAAARLLLLLLLLLLERPCVTGRTVVYRDTVRGPRWLR